MSKFGMKKGSLHDRADAEQVAHQHVPGRAYEVNDPATKLIHTIDGGGTEPGLWFALDDLTRRKVRVERMIFLSDLCCYTQGDDGTAKNCGVNLEKYFGKRATMQSMVDRFRQTVNPDCFVYSVNLSGHGQSQLRPGDNRTHLLSGWSEKLLDLVRDLEAGRPEKSEPNVQVPTIEVLRSRYRR
jgi:hypothetical protein